MTPTESFGDIVAGLAAFCVICFGSSRCAGYMGKLGIPLITGYIICGMIAGPYILNMIPSSRLGYLKFVYQVATAFIAMSAGCQFYLEEIRHLLRRIFYIAGIVVLITIPAVLGVVEGLASTDYMPFAKKVDDRCQAGIALMVACVSSARSPAAAVAILRELNAAGPFCKVMLGVTISTDIIIIFLFSITTSAARTLCDSSIAFDVISFVILLVSIICALGIGYLYSKVLTFLLLFKRLRLYHLIIPSGWLIFYLTELITDETLHSFGRALTLEPMIICVLGATLTTNTSVNRALFVSYLSEASYTVFIPFFVYSGCKLDVKKIFESIVFGLIVYIVRFLAIQVGSFIGCYLTNAPKSHLKYQGLSLVSQSAVSLALSGTVAAIFSSTFGSEFHTMMVTEIILSNFSGIVLQRWSIKKVGEAGMADPAKIAELAAKKQQEEEEQKRQKMEEEAKEEKEKEAKGGTIAQLEDVVVKQEAEKDSDMHISSKEGVHESEMTKPDGDAHAPAQSQEGDVQSESVNVDIDGKDSLSASASPAAVRSSRRMSVVFNSSNNSSNVGNVHNSASSSSSMRRRRSGFQSNGSFYSGTPTSSPQEKAFSAASVAEAQSLLLAPSGPSGPVREFLVIGTNSFSRAIMANLLRAGHTLVVCDTEIDELDALLDAQQGMGDRLSTFILERNNFGAISILQLLQDAELHRPFAGVFLCLDNDEANLFAFEKLSAAFKKSKSNPNFVARCVGLSSVREFATSGISVVYPFGFAEASGAVSAAVSANLGKNSATMGTQFFAKDD